MSVVKYTTSIYDASDGVKRSSQLIRDEGEAMYGQLKDMCSSGALTGMTSEAVEASWVRWQAACDDLATQEETFATKMSQNTQNVFDVDRQSSGYFV